MKALRQLGFLKLNFRADTDHPEDHRVLALFRKRAELRVGDVGGVALPLRQVSVAVRAEVGVVLAHVGRVRIHLLHVPVVTVVGLAKITRRRIEHRVERIQYRVDLRPRLGAVAVHDVE